MHRPYAFQSATLVIVTASLLAGCGKGSSTRLSYDAPTLPIHFSIGLDKDGNCAVAGGLATHVGTFAIEHSFPTREDVTYVVIRNRTRGTDTVFKITPSGFVDLHAVGDHQFRFHRDGNCFYFDIRSEWGTLDFTAHPSSSAIACVDFGEEFPDAIVTTDRKLTLRYPGIFAWPQTVPLDTISTVEFGRSWPNGRRWMDIHPKRHLGLERLRIEIGRENADGNCQALRAAIAEVAPEVDCRTQVHWLGDVSGLACILSIPCTLLAMVGFVVWCMRTTPTAPAAGGAWEQEWRELANQPASIPGETSMTYVPNSSDSPEYLRTYGAYDRNKILTQGNGRPSPSGPTGCLTIIAMVIGALAVVVSRFV